MKAKIRTVEVGGRSGDYWEWYLTVRGFLVHGTKCYATKRSALSAARRVAKQLGLEVEE